MEFCEDAKNKKLSDNPQEDLLNRDTPYFLQDVNYIL